MGSSPGIGHAASGGALALELAAHPRGRTRFSADFGSLFLRFPPLFLRSDVSHLIFLRSDILTLFFGIGQLQLSDLKKNSGGRPISKKTGEMYKPGPIKCGGKPCPISKNCQIFNFFWGKWDKHWIRDKQNQSFWKNQDDLQTQLTEFGLAMDAPERVGNRFTSLKKHWKTPLSSAPKTFRREETSLHQGRKNQDLIFNHILRSHGTEHVSMRKCPWKWILFSCESFRWNNKTVDTNWGVDLLFSVCQITLKCNQNFLLLTPVYSTITYHTSAPWPHSTR